ALYAPFEPADNLARMTFLDPAGRHFYADWDRAARAAVANLRQAAGFDPATRRSRLNGDLQGEFTVGAVWLSSGTHTADDVRVRGPRAVRGGRGQL
ncbi:hypothetical protein ACFXO2_12415, partial [Streptomyces sp. NPDC059152]